MSLDEPEVRVQDWRSAHGHLLLIIPCPSILCVLSHTLVPLSPHTLKERELFRNKQFNSVPYRALSFSHFLVLLVRLDFTFCVYKSVLFETHTSCFTGIIYLCLSRVCLSEAVLVIYFCPFPTVSNSPLLVWLTSEPLVSL